MLAFLSMRHIMKSRVACQAVRAGDPPVLNVTKTAGFFKPAVFNSCSAHALVLVLQEPPFPCIGGLSVVLNARSPGVCRRYRIATSRSRVLPLCLTGVTGAVGIIESHGAAGHETVTF